MRQVKKKNTIKYSIEMIKQIVKDILLFWNYELNHMINIMDIDKLNKKKGMTIKKKFKHVLKYLEKGHLFKWLHYNLETYYACIILFTIYSRCIYKNTKHIYKNDSKIYLFMEMGLDIYNIQINKLNIWDYNKYCILLPFQISEEYLHQLQGKEIIYQLLFNNNNNKIKNIIRKILYYQHKRIHILETFNRFPNRNKILKRDSIIEEIDFLDEMEYNNLKLIF